MLTYKERCKHGCAVEPVFTQKRFANNTFHYCRQCPKCGTILQSSGKYWLPAYDIEPMLDHGLIKLEPFRATS
jgi:hypothetical protein